MKALSIKQPWVWAILNVGKDIENRTWMLSQNRGRHEGRSIYSVSRTARKLLLRVPSVLCAPAAGYLKC
jgi:hypothetical protein